MNTNPPTSPFAPTRWSLVWRTQGASPEARAALSELCEAYYQPVLAFLRREGRDEDAARELAHEFFARLLERGGLGQADPAQGRFRSYLLGALKHFLADRREFQHRQKRRPEMPLASLDAPAAGQETAMGEQVADPQAGMTDVWFDRQWALTIMARVLAALEQECIEEGRADWFATLKPWLAGEGVALDAKTASARLGLSESAFKVAVHRLRRRFRRMVQWEVAQTLPEGANLDEELRYLIEVLSAAPSVSPQSSS